MLKIELSEEDVKKLKIILGVGIDDYWWSSFLPNFKLYNEVRQLLGMAIITEDFRKIMEERFR